MATSRLQRRLGPCADLPPLAQPRPDQLPPVALVGLEDLVGPVAQLDLLGWNDELLSSVSCLRLRLEQSQNWNCANSPLRWRLSHILDSNNGSIDTCIELDSRSESKGGSKSAVKG